MLGIVFANEYQRKVKTRTFALITLLVPFVIFGIGATVAVVSSFDSDRGETKQRDIAVLDPTGTILAALQQAARGAYRFTAVVANAEAAKQTVLDGGHDGLLTVPADLDAGFHFYVRQHGSISEQMALRNFVFRIVREARLSQHELSPQLRAVLASRPSFDVVRLTDTGEDRSGTVMALGVGGITAMLLAGFVVIYGGNVMQAVMEEKASRMAEIVVSSVRPFELLLGKILAAAAIGITQVAAWIALSSLLFLAATWILTTLGTPLVEAVADTALHGVTHTLADLPDSGFAISPAPIIVALLLLPFGFLIHASIFASLGALYENATDAQNVTVLALLPAMVTFVIAQMVVHFPDGSAVAFGSFFPFSAPAILPARMLVADVPAWHVAISIVLCVAGSLAMIWFAGRILRGSLLSYGKTPKLGDLRRILFGD